jgi:hypothetical protein
LSNFYPYFPYMVKSHHEKASHNHDRQPLPGPEKKKHTHTRPKQGVMGGT